MLSLHCVIVFCVMLIEPSPTTTSSDFLYNNLYVFEEDESALSLAEATKCRYPSSSILASRLEGFKLKMGLKLISITPVPMGSLLYTHSLGVSQLVDELPGQEFHTLSPRPPLLLSARVG